MKSDSELTRLRSELKEKDDEIGRLRSELERAVERGEKLSEARRAMLYMLEDLNRSAAELERGKKEWEMTFDAIEEPIFIHDSDFRIVKANRAYTEEAGRPFLDIVGRPYYDFFPVQEALLDSCRELTETKGGSPARAGEFRSPDGRIFRTFFFPVKDEEGNYLYSIHLFEDITESTKAEDRIREEVDITTSLLSIAETTSQTADIDKLVENVTSCARVVMGGDICLSYLWSEEDGCFRPSHASGLPADEVPLFKTGTIGEGVWFVRQALVEKRAVDIYAPFEREGYAGAAEPCIIGPLKWMKGIKTVLVIPLVGRAECSGILLTAYREERGFSERDRKIAEGMSRQLYTSLQEAKLYKESIERSIELSHRIETIKVMHEIDRSILSTLDRNAILETAMRLVAQAIPCDRATVFLADMEREGFVYQAGFGLDLPKGEFISFADTSLSEILVAGRSGYTGDIREEDKHPLPFERRLIEAGFVSHFRFPLIVKGKAIGVLSIGSRRTGAFTAQDMATLERLADQVGVALENARLLDDLAELFMGTIRALSSAIDAKSPWTAGHSGRVTSYALTVGRQMHLSDEEMKRLELAGLLHDVGKIGTYESVLNKPGKLTDEEFEMVKRHPAKGAELLTHIKQLKGVIPAIRHHHENYDGTGYPDGLKGEEIPLLARILTVTDTFDAMKADRPYRTGRDVDFIVGEFRRCSGTQFDPEIVSRFMHIIEGQELKAEPRQPVTKASMHEGGLR